MPRRLSIRVAAFASATLLSHCGGVSRSSSDGTPAACAPAYGPGWATALGTNAGSGLAIAVDAQGNVAYAGPPSFDGAGAPAFVGKLTSKGAPLFRQALNDTIEDAPGAGIGVATAADGGFFVIETATAATGGSGALVKRFAPDGAAVWSRTLTWSGNNWGGTFVASDGSGGAWIVGVELYIPTGGFTDVPNLHPFLAHLDSDGNVLWQQTLGTLDEIYPRGLAIAPNGNALIALQVNRGSLWTDEGGAPSGSFSTVVSFDAHGSLRWASTISQSQDDQLTSLATGAGGAIYVAGTSLNGNTVGAPTTTDAFLVALDTSGELQWRTSYSDSTLIGSPLIASKPCGGLTLAAGIPSDPVNAVVVIDLDPKGTEERRRFVTCPSGSCQVSPTGLAAQGADGVVLTGWFWDAFRFDSASVSTTLSEDGFFARLAD